MIPRLFKVMDRIARRAIRAYPEKREFILINSNVFKALLKRIPLRWEPPEDQRQALEELISEATQRNLSRDEVFNWVVRFADRAYMIIHS